MFATTIPFTSGTTFGDLFDFSQAFVDAIYYWLVRREIVATGEASESASSLGRLAFDAHFDLQLGDLAPVSVWVKATDTVVNTSLEQLADTFNHALAAAGLGAAVEATVTSNRRFSFRLKSGAGVSGFNIGVPDPDGSASTPNTDAMVAELGFGATQYSVEVPNYAGIEDFSEQLSEAATAGVPLDVQLTYDEPAKEIRMRVSFHGEPRSLTFRFDPDLGLGPLADASASGTLSIEGHLDAGFTLGFDLNPLTTPRLLTNPLVPPPSTGVLTRTAKFTLKLDDTRYDLVLPPDASNASLADLVADLNGLFTDTNGLRIASSPRCPATDLLSVLNEDLDGDAR